MPPTVKAEIDCVDDVYLFNIGRIAQRVQETVLNPFCDKYGLKFTTGMGGWSINSLDRNRQSFDWDYYIDDNYADLDCAEDYDDIKPPEGYEEVRELLILETLQGELFEFMEDYAGEDK